MNRYKKYTLSLTCAFLTLVVFHIGTLLAVDPLNIFNAEITDNEFFIKEMRFQSAGIINKHDFDSAIVGTSMAGNFNANQAGHKLQGRFVNLSLSGSLLNERKIVLEYLLSEKDMKTIIISLDGATSMQRNEGIPIASWEFLYNKNRFDDFILYTNNKYMPYISCHSMFASRLSDLIYGECPKHKIKVNMNELTEWQSDPNHNSRFGGIEKWIENRENPQISQSIMKINSASILLKKNALEAETDSKNIFDIGEFSRNIPPILEHNPNTRFILFFPPYSMVQYAIDAQTAPHKFDQYKRLVEGVVLMTELYLNTEVYWFGDKDFVKNLSNYKDHTHYHGKYNNYFLDEFKAKRSIINIENYKELLNELERNAKSVDLIKLADRLNTNENAL